MIKILRSVIKRYFTPKAMVLMYHRIAELESDVWNLAVSPANFEQQLQILTRKKNVVSLKELVEGIANNTLKDNSLALTFDDGYQDNYLIAKPLLEKYKVPATFFITSGNIGEAREFWWDELEFIILFSEILPSKISMKVDKKEIKSDLSSEEYLSKTLRQKHKSWKAIIQPAPSKRADLFLQLWECLRPLKYVEQLIHLKAVRKWASIGIVERPAYFCMKKDEIIEIGKSNCIDIGSHTVNHPALAFHDTNYQCEELKKNRQYLGKILERNIEMLAYPYGSYNHDTQALAKSLHFQAAFSTEEKLITADSNKFSLGRFVVPDICGKSFIKFLS